MAHTELETELYKALKAQIQMRDTVRPRKLEEALTWRANDELADRMAKTAMAKYEEAENGK